MLGIVGSRGGVLGGVGRFAMLHATLLADSVLCECVGRGGGRSNHTCHPVHLTIPQGGKRGSLCIPVSSVG